VVGETGAAPLEIVTAMTLMLAPLAPHLAEEVWSRLGHAESLVYEPFPEPDPAYLVVEEVEIPVQVNGKVRARVKVPAGVSEADHEAAARADERVAQLLGESDVHKVVVVPGRLVNFVTA
jgi:leucyl-tRNA synthetase